MQPPTSAETETRDTPFCFFPFLPHFLGWTPLGTRLRRLVIIIPLAYVSETHRVHSLYFPSTLFFVLRIMFTALTTDTTST
jgi:hypothetical protein